MPVNLQAEKAVQQITESFVDAWNRHDARSFAANFARDADFTNVFGMHAKGREAIEGFHRPIFETMFRDSRLTLDETRMRVVRPDVVAVDMRWAMTGARNPLGAEWPRRTGLINILVTREENAWSIAVMHNMDFPDPDMVEAQKALQEQKQK